MSVSKRLKSIDILRALTMLLMIFVNDLWSLADIPDWLGHKAAHEDGMGLADVVFPAFLFMVGLSIPHAIRARLKRGDTKVQVLRHVFERTLALLIMGVFMVNLENIDVQNLLFSKSVWQILMTLAFFLIWNVYKDPLAGKHGPWILKALGWALGHRGERVFLDALPLVGHPGTDWLGLPAQCIGIPVAGQQTRMDCRPSSFSYPIEYQ
jgi:hypothetical protein